MFAEIIYRVGRYVDVDARSLALVVAVSPLVSITKDWVVWLQSIGIVAAFTVEYTFFFIRTSKYCS